MVSKRQVGWTALTLAAILALWGWWLTAAGSDSIYTANHDGIEVRITWHQESIIDNAHLCAEVFRDGHVLRERGYLGMYKPDYRFGSRMIAGADTLIVYEARYPQVVLVACDVQTGDSWPRYGPDSDALIARMTEKLQAATGKAYEFSDLNSQVLLDSTQARVSEK